MQYSTIENDAPAVAPLKNTMVSVRLVKGAEGIRRKRIQVKSPDDVFDYIKTYFADKPTEEVVVVMLNTANVIIASSVVSTGGLAASIVEPRAVFQRMILANAAAFVMVHNHPSGNLEPSREDIRITRQMNEAGKIMGMPMHDHLIVAANGFTSLAERGLMQ